MSDNYNFNIHEDILDVFFIQMNYQSTNIVSDILLVPRHCPAYNLFRFLPPQIVSDERST